MDELGEFMALGAVVWFVCDDNRLKLWPFMVGLFVLGAILYFIDRAIKRPTRR